MSTPADWDDDPMQRTWLAFAPIIKAVIGYSLSVAACAWGAAIIEELWTRGVPFVSLTFGLFGMGMAFTLAYFLGSMAAGLSLASVTILNGSLRNFLKPKTAGLLGGGLAAYLLTLPFMVNVAEAGDVAKLLVVLLAGPASLTTFVYVAITWRFRRAELMAAADTLIGRPIDRRSLQAAVKLARHKTSKRWLRRSPPKPIAKSQAVHPLDRTDGDDEPLEALRETLAQSVEPQLAVVPVVTPPVVASPHYRSDQWTTRQVFLLTVWIAVPLGIVVACGGTQTPTVGTIVIGFVLCQAFAFLIAKLLALPINWILTRQVVKYVTLA